MDRDTKLIAILRRQYHIILTALGENIFRIGLRRFATPPNTEYIFSQLAVNIMWYCRLKIAISIHYTSLKMLFAKTVLFDHKISYLAIFKISNVRQSLENILRSQF